MKGVRRNPLTLNIEDDQFKSMISGAGSRFELWEQVIRNLKAEIVAEIGVWKGAVAKHMLERCTTIWRYYMIGTWANLPDWNKPYNVSPTESGDVYAEAMQKTEFAAEKRIVLRGVSREVSVYFAEAMNLPIVALPFNQLVIEKRNDSAFNFIDLTGQYKNLSLSRHSSLLNLFAIKRQAKRVLSKIGLKR